MLLLLLLLLLLHGHGRRQGGSGQRCRRGWGRRRRCRGWTEGLRESGRGLLGEGGGSRRWLSELELLLGARGLHLSSD